MKHPPQTTLATLLFALALNISAPPAASAVDIKLPERAIVTQAKHIRLPEFKLEGVTFMEAVRQLSLAARQQDPEKKGVNFMLEPGVAATRPKITLALKNVTVAEAAERLAKAAGVSVTAHDYAFAFHPKPAKP